MLVFNVFYTVMAIISVSFLIFLYTKRGKKWLKKYRGEE